MIKLRVMVEIIIKLLKKDKKYFSLMNSIIKISGSNNNNNISRTKKKKMTSITVIAAT